MTKNTAFLGLNLDLLENPKYADIDPRAMMLYSLYADRQSCSLHNAMNGNKTFVDEKGVFIYFDNALAADLLHCTIKTVTKFRAQLKKAGLISVIRQGLQSYKIYVFDVESTPSNVDLKLPWKNVKNNAETLVEQDSPRVERFTSTGEKNILTSTSKGSTSKKFKNMNELNTSVNQDDHKQSVNQIIIDSYQQTFGMTNQSIRKSLQGLIAKSSAELVNCAIYIASKYQLTSPIRYITSIITNAINDCVTSASRLYSNFKNQKEANRANYVHKNSYSRALNQNAQNNNVIVPILKIC